ncbi:MAG TPA: leucine-rich repeat domain-containing protein, partial [Desulfuromonadaceae bacterium]|nr:leucine-rich repeat domain-containing protein [Desulfuromonadaceae bacterium]
SLTSVAIPSSVTSIGNSAFYICPGLKEINVDPQNPAYSSVDGVLFNKDRSVLIAFPGGWVGDYTMPAGVIMVEFYAFEDCPNLTGVTVPDSVTYIAPFAFSLCGALGGIYFQGDAPAADPTAFSGDHVIVYHLPGKTGWDSTFAGAPTALWFLPQPILLSGRGNVGAQTNGFGFIISWATNTSVVVEASSTLADLSWLPVQTNLLVNGVAVFNDPQWTNFLVRFYRVRPQ